MSTPCYISFSNTHNPVTYIHASPLETDIEFISPFDQWEKKVDKYQEEFDTISKNIRVEITRFEKQRVKDFKATIINYLESLMSNQQQVGQYA